MTTTRWALLLALLTLARSAKSAEADLGIGEPPPELPPPAADRADTSSSHAGDGDGEHARVERTFSFIPSPTLPAPWQVLGGYSASYASTEAATRPLAALAARGGFVSSLDAELGLHRRFSLDGSLFVAPSRGGADDGRAAGRFGVRGALVDPRAQPFRLTAFGGYARDFAGVSSPFLELSSSLDVDRVRFGGLVHAERALASGRDGMDLYAAAGLSVRALDSLRLGLEYLGQEFEAAWERTEAEGGIVHFAGANAALTPSERVFIVAGPALGLSERSPRFLGRASLGYLF